jgi:uncharacterized membrane protein
MQNACTLRRPALILFKDVTVSASYRLLLKLTTNSIKFLKMRKLAHTGKWLYASAFAIFGIQHFMYADFVATLVPAWMPWHLFLAYLTGTAFIAAALSIIINKYVKLSCTLLSLLLALFVLLLHIPNLSSHPQNAKSWTRALQDVVIMGTALMLTGNLRLFAAGKYLYAVPMVILGAQHFAHTSFVTAKVPAYFPAIAAYDYIIGFVIIVAALGIITNRYLGVPAAVLGLLLLFFVILYHMPLLMANIYSGQQWTAAMLDVAITGGAFIVSTTPALRHSSYKVPAF